MLVLVATFVLVAAACGSGEGSGSVASAEDVEQTEQVEPEEVATQGGDTETAEDTSDPVDTEAALLAFTQCLRDEGIQVDDPQMDADGNVNLRSVFQAAGIDRREIDDAMGVCGESLEGVQQHFSEVDETEREDGLLAFAQCMRDNGIDMDDPDVSNSGPGGGGDGSGDPSGHFGELDREDPDFQKALEACGDSLAGFGRGRTGGGEDG